MKPEEVMAWRERLINIGFTQDGQHTVFAEDRNLWCDSDKIAIVVDPIGVVFLRPGRISSVKDVAIISEVCCRTGNFADPRLEQMLQ